ncbi:hypothetical protein CYY_001774 [Polysphondylium violaceum]|uniref:RCC1-like domain-containing protein n=1 Tax=Polysphondylium violaceum TaxID=133409 RepID=A0A8J4UVV7_9MYCE|nr:hypothetical protein CYY_001774 [Polysphondylium violaceum]
MNLGRLFVFGKNSHGQLGVELGKEVIYDQDNYTCDPTLIQDYEDVELVSCGVSHTGFIAGGEIYTFGNGSFGKLGLGTAADQKIPRIVYAGQNIKFSDLQCGNEHTIAKTIYGDVYCWGSGSFGRIGNSSFTSIWTPIRVLTGAQSVYAGGASSAAVMKDGSVKTWGYNKYGQLGVGHQNNLNHPENLTFFHAGNKVISFSIGDRHMGAVNESGELYTWGCNEDYQLGEGLLHKSTPFLVKFKNIGARFKFVKCGGMFTAGIANHTDNNALYIWGTFVKEYSSTSPKRYFEDVDTLSLSSDCGRHMICKKLNGEVWSFGWGRYGQTGYENNDDTILMNPLKRIVGTPTMVSCGSYHSAILYNDPYQLFCQMIKLNYFEQATTLMNTLKLNKSSTIDTFRNHNQDSIFHILCKQRTHLFFSSLSSWFSATDLAANYLNDEQIPPFFYYAKILQYHTNRAKVDINYQLKNGDTCLHYYARNNMIEDLELALGLKADDKIRNNDKQLALDLLAEKPQAFAIKKKFRLHDIGIIYSPSFYNLAAKIQASFEESFLNCVLISSKDNEDRNCLCYIFFVSRESLSNRYMTAFLLDFASKGPMISIWAEKLAITDPTLESCIYRSQLVDFSSSDIYKDSLSVLFEGVYNMINSTGSDDDDQEDSDNKPDTEVVTVSDQKSVFISCDPTKLGQFTQLTEFLSRHNISVTPREKGILSSWVVLLLVTNAEFSPLIKDEVSLAENRNKPVIPIYYADRKVDEAFRYSFANSPKIQYNEMGFNQILLLIQLYYKQIECSTLLFQLKNK